MPHRKMPGMFLTLEPSLVTSRCPLLPPEKAEDYLPAAYMPVPRNSAWISSQVDVAQFINGSGAVDRVVLKQALLACIDEGERRHDETDWSEPSLKHDSWLNRRLAIALRGWGGVVERRGLDPRSLQTLRELESLAEFACKTLHTRSRQLASGRNWCPALDEARTRVLGKDASHSWSRRWRRAISDVAVRHRNLTTMSPWDVFPDGSAADLAFADLLPVMRFADSLSFQRNVSIEHWNASNFKGFHGRVAAMVRCNGGAGLVAKQV